MTLEQYIKSQLDTFEQFGLYDVPTDTVRAWIDLYHKMQP